MPVNGKRKNILNGLVTLIQGATGGSYFYNYSLPDVVSLNREPDTKRLQAPGGVTVRISDGAERHSARGVDAGVTAALDVILLITLKAAPGNLVAATADAIADMTLVLGTNPNPGGTGTSVRIDSIEPPFYEFSQEYSKTVMHLRAEYDYESGVDT